MARIYVSEERLNVSILAFGPKTHTILACRCKVFVVKSTQPVGETSSDIAAYAQRHLFQSLGINSYYWRQTPAGLSGTAGGLYLKRDFPFGFMT